MTTATVAHPVPLADRLADELDALGECPDRIADVLWAADARGGRRSPDGNPLARYLRRRLRGAVNVTASDGRLTPAAREFLVRFDLGLYPELEAV